jgi:hypothetical protein
MFDRSDTLSTSARSIVWQTGKRFRQLCTAREHFSSNKQISIYLVFVVLWYENMSADININNKFSYYEELSVFKGNYEKYNFIQLYTRTSQTLDYFFKRNPSRKASVNLKYSIH